MTKPTETWEGDCALETTKNQPRCATQCPTCRIHAEAMQHAHQIAAEEVAKLGKPGAGW